MYNNEGMTSNKDKKDAINFYLFGG